MRLPVLSLFFAALALASFGLTGIAAYFQAPSSEAADALSSQVYRLQEERKELLGSLSAKAAPEQQVEILCEALAHTTELLHLRPRHAPHYLEWARLRGLLGKISCGDPALDQPAHEALDFAVTLEPTNDELRVAVAREYRKDGDRSRAARHIRESVLLNATFSQRDSAEILSLAADSDELVAMFPAVLPHVQILTRAWVRKSRAEKERFRPALEELQREALSREVKTEETPNDLLREQLWTIQRFAASGQVRRRVDEVLASGRFPELEQEEGEYLAARASLSELPVVLTALRYDGRPLRNQFSQWEVQGRIDVGKDRSSIGFVTPEKSTVKIIELHSTLFRPGASIRGAALYTSDDNLNWKLVPFQIAPQVHKVDSGQWISFRPSYGESRLWKIHFGGTGRTAEPVEAERALRIFGVGPGKGASER